MKRQTLGNIIPLVLAASSSSCEAWTAAPYQPSPHHHPYNNNNPNHDDEEGQSSSSSSPLQHQPPRGASSSAPPLPQQLEQSLYVPTGDQMTNDYGLISPLLHSSKPEWAIDLADQLDLTGSSCPDGGCSPPATIRLGEAVKIRNPEATWEPFYVSVETTDDVEAERFIHDYWTTKTGCDSSGSSSWCGLTTRVTSGIFAPKGGSGLYSDEVTITVEEDQLTGGLSTLAPLYLVVRTQNDYWSWRIASGNSLRQRCNSLQSLRP